MTLIPIDSHTAPQLCRWLRFKDGAGRGPSSWTEATCIRVREQTRDVVPAYDCVGCRHWALRDDS